MNRFKKFLSNLKYRKKTQIIFCDEQFKVIERHYDLAYIPQKDDLVLPTDSKEYYVVLRIIHKLNSPYTIWVVIDKI